MVANAESSDDAAGHTEPPRPVGRGGTAIGMAVVVVLFLLAAGFLWALFSLTDGKRRAPPPETRDPNRAAPREGG